MKSCVTIEELLALPDGEPDDPRWAHVRSCPRCRSRIAAYGLFTAAEDPGPEEDAVVDRLSRALRAKSQGRPARAGTRAGRADRVAGPTFFERLRAALAGPSRAWIPLAGATAVLVGAFLYLREEAPSWRTPKSVLREDDSSLIGRTLSTFPTRRLPAGGLELRWSSLGSADSYRVRLLDADFHTTAVIAAGRDTLLDVPPEKLAGAVYWQAQATSQGDPIAESVPLPLP